MTHLVLGPYRILGTLGRGGMGQVFRGQHRESGQLVALKTVRAPSALHLSSLRREVRALGQARHPGLVRILDQGVDEGRPWYAMELLHGRTLRDVMAGDGHGPADGEPTLPTGEAPPPARPRAHGPLELARIAPLLALLRDVCAPLAALHGAGLVHRDLKPENIFVTERGAPVLVDLGIAARFSGASGRESFTSGDELRAIGTRSYMAPEQLGGELVDARTDLYALGVILYECLTGQRPFSSPGPGGVLARHSGQRPLAPSLLVPGLPPELDGLVLRLLEPRPRARPGYAEDVAALLEQWLGEWGHASPREDAGRASVPHARPWLYRPELTGREHVLGGLEVALEQLQHEGRGGRIYLGGASGVGKTRLVMELAQRAMGRGLAVMSCPCRPGDALSPSPLSPAPLQPFRPLLLALADRCRAGEAPVTETLLGPAGRVLAAHEPALGALPGLERYPEPPPLDATGTRLRLFDALGSALVALAAHAPLVLVMDDLQWADELSLGFLRGAGLGPLAEAPILLLGTYRNGAPGGRLSSIIEAAGSTHVELDRLDDGSVRAMAASMLALPEVPADIGGFLTSAAEGNPFFVAECLRAAIDGGALARERDGRWRFLPGAPGGALPSLPRSLSELLSGRMDALDAPAREALEAAAVLGHACEAELLIRLAGLEEPVASDALRSLCLRALLEEEEGQLHFIHERLRETVTTSLPPARREALHRRAALLLEGAGPVHDGLHAALAVHHAGAGAHDRAHASFVRAAEHARRTYAHEQAAALYQAALREAEAHPGPMPTGTRAPRALREHLGELLGVLGHQEEARTAYGQVLRELPATEALARARLHRKLGKTWEPHHRHEEALAAFDRAEHCLGEAPPAQEETAAWWQEWVQLQIERISTYYWTANTPALEALVQRAGPGVRAQGTPLQRARFFQSLVQRDLRAERYAASAETVEHARRSVLALEESGERVELATARFTLGAVLLWHGALDEAETVMRAALDEAERLAHVPLQARCASYLTQLHRQRGRTGTVQRLAPKAAKVARACQMADYVAAAEANLGWVAWCEGRHAEAETLCQAALARWAPLSLVFPFQWMARWPLLALAHARGDSCSAVNHARALLEPQQQRLPPTTRARLEDAVARHEQAHPAASAARLAEALELARGQGQL
ncbi:serine/threonine-protein kinase [Archangium violaceum]|uniref:serine/threonine-protein kinase n=1 Tax=Archangium violaceum TaxID=83451 RepID=UPI0036DE0D95